MTKVALYVEGSLVARTWVEGPLARLWKALAARVCVAPEVEVIDINKGHIEHLRFEPSQPGSGVKLPTNVIGVDQLIKDRHAMKPLDNVVIAFDCKPAISAPGIAGAGRCPEITWLLDRLITRRVLPSPFLADAARLNAWYRSRPKAPRGPGRPPRLSLEILFMDPCFEALFASDPATIRTATGHRRYPKDWPTFDPKAQAPERAFLDRATALATREARAGIRGNYLAAKSDWGHRFVTSAAENAAIFKHPIAQRLGTLLA